METCYAVGGIPLFEYTGYLRDAVNQFIQDQESSPYDEDGNFIDLFFPFDLPNSNLQGMTAMNLDLHGSNFSGSDLYWGCFRECNLENVNFSNCSLRGASLDGANLKKANFQNANLGFANMGVVGATIVDADLNDAIIENTVLAGCAYNSRTIFPKKFVPPPWMIKQNDNESYTELSERIKVPVYKYFESFSETQRQEIIFNGIPYDVDIQKRFADILSGD